MMAGIMTALRIAVAARGFGRGLQFAAAEHSPHIRVY